ncbi:energy transducer TonB [Sphingomicrobium flavum]|uniref:energy transducer TonB n=1 Tax=Sphingomicrobium flavum TaxID=1229164 RepID=UPI0021AE18B9|nr:energy transducer TonB [Sphingomicrobium flavum]
MILALPMILTSLTGAIAAPPAAPMAPPTLGQMEAAAAERELDLKAGRVRGTARVVNGGEVARGFSYPSQAMREAAEGDSVIEVRVDRQGGIEECVLLRSAGHAALDQASCVQFTRTARFEPARARDGEPVPGLYRQTIVRRLPEQAPISAPQNPEQ